MEIRHNEGAIRHSETLDRETRNAWAAYVKQRWPTNTAKLISREWDLTLDEAKGLVAARTSLATIDRIAKHPSGGWSVLIPVMSHVIGHGLDAFLEQEQRKLRHEREQYEAREARLGEMARDLSLAFGVGRRGGAERPTGRRREDREHRSALGD